VGGRRILGCWNESNPFERERREINAKVAKKKSLSFSFLRFSR
jgi:hypothetical protein